MNEHTCPGPGCKRVVPDTMLMCPKHWKQVPFALRRAVLQAYNYGAGKDTPEHTLAVRAAICSLHTLAEKVNSAVASVLAPEVSEDIGWTCDFCEEERPYSCLSVVEKEVLVPGKTSSSFPSIAEPPPICADVTSLPMRKRHCNDRPACIQAAQEWIPRLEVFDPG